MLAPVLEELAREQADRLKIVKVNVDDNPGLATRYGIRSIPTLLFFFGGKMRAQTVGAVGKQAILSKLEAFASTTPGTLVGT
jgi:thioredoxin-like negative regulator of GroEL